MNFYPTYLLFLFSLLLPTTTWAEHLTVIDKGSNLAYTVNAKELPRSKMAFAVDIYEPSYFQNDQFSYLDIFNETDKNNAFIIAAKSAFTITGLTPKFFTEKILISKEFINRTIAKATISSTGNPGKLYLEKESYIRQLGKTIYVEGTLHPYIFPTGNILNSLEEKQFNDLNRVDKNLGIPEITMVVYLENAKKYIHGNYTVLKFFTSGTSNTLVVIYQIITIKPEDWWPIPRFLLKRNADSEIVDEAKYAALGIKKYAEEQ